MKRRELLLGTLAAFLPWKLPEPSPEWEVVARFDPDTGLQYDPVVTVFNYDGMVRQQIVPTIESLDDTANTPGVYRVTFDVPDLPPDCHMVLWWEGRAMNLGMAQQGRCSWGVLRYDLNGMPV